MVEGPNLKARTQYISALIPKTPPAKHDQLESGYGSTNSTSDDSSRYRQSHTAKSRKHRRQTPPPTRNISRSKSVLHGRHQTDSGKQHQQQVQQLNLDPIDNYRRLKTANTRISIGATPFQKYIPNQKVYSSANSKQLCSKHTDISTERSRKLRTPTKNENEVVDYSDDWNSDYSDDWESDKDNIPKSITKRQPPISEPIPTNNFIGFVPADPAAFEASFCLKRQAAIDNMSYRQAINSWTAKGLHDVVKLTMGLSSGKSLIDRAWIIFYWISQNIEYDVEAYFSGNIRHQTPDDIFVNRKGVCDAFGTIFETLCTAVQIECKKISGYAKGYSFKLEHESFTRTNHAWNVIRLEGHWYLVDSTWGQGHLDANKRNRKELESFYFLVRPEQMIYRHLPEDSRWQLLTSPISMSDFVRLPYVYSTFFEHSLDVIYPHHSSKASFNPSLGLAEVLVRAPSDTFLMGDITPAGSNKIKNVSLVQYDADRQLWQCLFAPQHSGFHTLTIFTRRQKQTMESKTKENMYSAATQFSLHVPTDFVKTKTFPLTYGLFTERKCQIFEPLDSAIKSGAKVTIHCRIPGAYCARLTLDGNWLSENLIKDGIFKREITVPKREVGMYVQFSDKRNTSSYDGLFCYSIK